MKVALLVNPRSGRERGARAGEALQQRIVGAGHECARLDVGEALDGRLGEALRGAGALVVAGGDGTAHHAAPVAMEAGVPIYHAPLGTENLFAREFGMRRRSQAVVDALATGRTRSVDAGQCAGRVFLVMCSLGADASVIHRMHAGRNGGIRRISYAPHLLAEAMRPALPRLTVRVDGRELVRHRRGVVIVANSRQYAARLDPAREAIIDDGLLDALFLPATTTIGLLLWAARCALGRAWEHPKAACARAERVEVEWEGAPPPAQIDGEAMTLSGRSVEMRALPRALSVLLPKQGGRREPRAR